MKKNNLFKLVLVVFFGLSSIQAIANEELSMDAINNSMSIFIDGQDDSEKHPLVQLLNETLQKPSSGGNSLVSNPQQKELSVLKMIVASDGDTYIYLSFFSPLNFTVGPDRDGKTISVFSVGRKVSKYLNRIISEFYEKQESGGSDLAKIISAVNVDPSVIRYTLSGENSTFKIICQGPAKGNADWTRCEITKQ